jgi:hypothetical protein
MASESGSTWWVYTRPTVTRMETGPAEHIVENAGASVQVASSGLACASCAEASRPAVS